MRTAAIWFTAVVLAATADAGKRPGWADADRDCQNTRAEVLIASCEVLRDAKGCHVTLAVCRDIYSGETIATAHPSRDIQIDHLLPQSVARERWTGTEAAFIRFYNDPENLVPTSARGNERKGALMPDQWCPAATWWRQTLAIRFAVVAMRHHIALTSSEMLALASWHEGRCTPHAKMIP